MAKSKSLTLHSRRGSRFAISRSLRERRRALRSFKVQRNLRESKKSREYYKVLRGFERDGANVSQTGSNSFESGCTLRIVGPSFLCSSCSDNR